MEKLENFLTYEFLIRLPAISQFKNGRVQKRVGSREDVMSSNQDIKTNMAILVCRRGVQGSCFILRRVFFVYTCLEKIMPSSRCVVWLDDVTSSLDLTLSFELGHF